MPELSVVVPVYKEAAVLPELQRRLGEVLADCSQGRHQPALLGRKRDDAAGPGHYFAPSRLGSSRTQTSNGTTSTRPSRYARVPP